MNTIAAFDRPIAFHRVFVEIGGSVNAALLLANALLHQSNCSEPTGFWCRTEAQISQETGLTRKEQASARQKLEAAGVLIVERHGLPAMLHYRVDEARLLAAISKVRGPK